MPNITPIVSSTINQNENILIESSALDFNQFNQGVISEKFTVIRFSVYSDNKLQLDEQLQVEYLDANGGRKQFAKAPRVDKYQLSNILSCLDIPKILCDGLNRFSYNILPATEVYILFEIDKRGSVSEYFKQTSAIEVNQNEEVIKSMFDGYNTEQIEQEIMPSHTNNKFLSIEGENYSNNNLSNKHRNIKESKNIKTNSTLKTIGKIAAITIPFLILLYGLHKLNSKNEN